MGNLNVTARDSVGYTSNPANAANVEQEKEQELLFDYKPQENDIELNLGNYGTNTKNNMFFKEYIEKKAKSKGVQIPEGFEIKISSPDKFSDEYKELLRYVRKEIYEARVNDMFNLLASSPAEVQARVEQMLISDEDKSKILKLKEMFDQYYKIEGEYKGKKINLLNLDNEADKVLEQLPPEFSAFLKEESPNFKKTAVDFTKKEIKNSELSEAGKFSRWLAPVVMGVMGFSLYRGFKETKEGVEAAKNSAKFLQEQKEIFAAGRPKFVNPLKAYREAFKGAKGKGLGAIIGGGVLASYLWKTMLGSFDDLSGAGKDFVQDTDNFGWGWGPAIAVPSAIMGVLSSAFIAPTIDAHIQHNRAEKILKKNGVIPKLKGFSKVANMAKKGALWGALGVVIAACSSGSSWTSMAGTRWLFGHKGDNLEKKNIITKEENSFKASNDNS